MHPLTRHLSRCFLAGVVAILPATGLLLTLAYLESTIAGSWLAQQPFYIPGLGLMLAVLGIYLIGLAVSTFLGRWLWGHFDALVDRLPLLGQLYQTCKQILGYGHGKGAIFQRVVLVADNDSTGEEIGLVTGEISGASGQRKLTVFIPGAPNPTNGRLVILDAGATRPLDLPVSDALKTIVSLGKTSTWNIPQDRIS